MSAHAKSVLAALAAVVIIGIQAAQVATVGGFRPVDLLPISTAVVGALLTYVTPNVPEWPWAKSGVHGALAVLTALTTFTGSHPAGVTVANLGTVALFSLLVWFVPELTPLAAPLAAGQHADGLEITDALHALDPLPAVPAAPAVWTQTPPPPVLPAPRLEATPIADDVQSALQTTSPMPAVPADTPPPAPIPAA